MAKLTIEKQNKTEVNQYRAAGDPGINAPAGIDHDGVPIELTDRVDPDTGEIFADPENQMVKHPALGAPIHRVSDVVESGFDEFYPGAERVSLEDVIAMGDVVILDCVIVNNFESKFGSHTLAIVAIVKSLGVDGSETMTFPTSGQVVVDKLRQLKAKGALPCLGAFVKERRYYDLR